MDFIILDFETNCIIVKPCGCAAALDNYRYCHHVKPHGRAALQYADWYYQPLRPNMNVDKNINNRLQ